MYQQHPMDPMAPWRPGEAFTSGLGDKLCCRTSMAQRRHSCATRITGRCSVKAPCAILGPNPFSLLGTSPVMGKMGKHGQNIEEQNARNIIICLIENTCIINIQMGFMNH